MYSLKNATCQFRVAWHLTSGYFCQWCTFYQTKYSLLARSDTKHWKWNHYVNLTCLSLKKWPLLFLDMTYHLSGVHLNIFLAVELLWRQLFLTAIELKQWFFIKGRALDCLHCFVFFPRHFQHLIWLQCVLYLWALKLCYPTTLFLLRYLPQSFSMEADCSKCFQG